MLSAKGGISSSTVASTSAVVTTDRSGTCTRRRAAAAAAAAAKVEAGTKHVLELRGKDTIEGHHRGNKYNNKSRPNIR